MLRSAPLTTLAVIMAANAWAEPAAAHISLDQAGTHLSRYGDNEIKDGPCGRLGGTRGINVYTYQPGETITVSISEFVPHPSYFRIAFDDDGDDDFVDPVSIEPIDPNRACPFNEFDQCGLTDDYQDFYNTKAVLPGMDNLDPHLTADFGQIYTWDVTLPNVQCDSCTLQIIQVMEDTIHGGYNTDKSIEPTYIEDVYHQCIDLVLEGPLKPSSDGGASGGAGDAGDGAPGGVVGASSSADDGSGCSCRLGARRQRAAGVGLWGVVLAWMVHRRRSQRGSSLSG